MERLLSMWGLTVALGTIAFISAVVSRQLWLIVSNVGMLLVVLAQAGIGGRHADLVLWTGLAMVWTGIWRQRRPAKSPYSP